MVVPTASDSGWQGRPRPCQGEAITETRIITTADIFDAITAKRPYRDAIPVP